MPELVCSADDPRWAEERRRGVTATDITAIIGLSPYESAYSLFFKKRGDIPDTYMDNDRLRLGRELEPIIINRWVRANKYAVDNGDKLYRNSTRPWQMATPDDLVYELSPPELAHIGPPRSNEACGVLEAKSWADIDCDRWADGPPARVRAQVLWQMDTLDVATGHVGVLFLPSGEFRSYTIEHDASVDCAYHENVTDDGACQVCLDQQLLRSAGRDFMDRLDLNDPPSPDASSATLAALKARFTDIHHDKTAEIDAQVWSIYDEARTAVDERKQIVREMENVIREQAGEARTLTVNGTKVATRVVGDSQVKAHTRHNDYIRRTTSKGETGE